MLHRNRLKRVLPAAAILASLLLSLAARGESLANRVPADAVAFAQWQGGDALGKSYDSSKLKKFLDVLNLPDLLSRKFQEETDKQDPQKQADAKFLKELLTTVTKSPT